MSRKTRGHTRFPADGGGHREWLGGKFTAPCHITGEGEPYRPTMTVWVELPEGCVVGTAMNRPREQEGAVGRALEEAMLHPLVGPARRPSRIRVADPEIAAEVREIVGDAIPVTIGPTPELEEVRDSFFEFLTKKPKGGAGHEPDLAEASYFAQGRVSPDAVADLFAAARILRTVAPWKLVNDEQVLRVDSPGLDLHGACVSIIGALGQNLGFLIFPSLGGFQRFLNAASKRRPKRSRLDLGTSWLSLGLVPDLELSALQRSEVAAHRWPVADRASYPQVEHWDRDGLLRPLVERDVRVAAVCAMAVSRFVMRNCGAFEADGIEPVFESICEGKGPPVHLTFPYEALPLFDVETDPRPASSSSSGRVPRRNDPCRCGSGKKYKVCHLAEDSGSR